MTLAGMPGPLSTMMILSPFTSTEMIGAIPASSQASRLLSVNSFSTTSVGAHTREVIDTRLTRSATVVPSIR
jgi:hypothetical protein